MVIDKKQASTQHDVFESYTALPLLLLALIDLPILVWEGLAWLGQTAHPPLWVQFLVTAIWVIYAIDLAIRLYLTQEGWFQYLKKNWIDVVIVLLPMLRILKLLRILRSVKAINILKSFITAGAVKVVLAIVSLAMISTTSIVYLAEWDATGNTIASFWDALWWAISTTTGVEYGDIYPVTVIGRLAAVLLVLMGITLLGVLTANITAYLIRSKEMNSSDCPHCRDVVSQ